MEDDPRIHVRKDEHIISALKYASAQIMNGFNHYHVMHCALPEMNFYDIDSSVRFLGYKVSAPLIIDSLTGGTEIASMINHNLAIAAQKTGVPLSIGSAKIIFYDSTTISSFMVREFCPDIPLIVNLGIVDLDRTFSVEDCRRLVQNIRADALVFHLNPVHEAMRPDGSCDFTGIFDRLKNAVQTVGVPVIVKEVGHGISRPVFEKIDTLGLYAVDIAGAGGTSWGAIEADIASDPIRKAVCHTFEDWGIPTPRILESLSDLPRTSKLIASGGIRSGIDLFKALCLGADFGAAALPFLKPAIESSDSVAAVLDQFILEFKIAMFGAGIRNLSNVGPHLLCKK